MTVSFSYTAVIKYWYMPEFLNLAMIARVWHNNTIDLILWLQHPMLYYHAVIAPHKLWFLRPVTVHCARYGPPGQTLETNPDNRNPASDPSRKWRAQLPWMVRGDHLIV